MVTITKYNKIAIYHAISYLMISTGDDINTNNNKNLYPALKIFSEEASEIKLQEWFVLK